MKLFFRYLRQRRGLICALALFCALFAVSFALYRLPWRAVAYPAALCAVLGLVLLALDFRRVRARHRQLERVETMADAAENLPAPRDIAEEDYQRLVELLRREQADLRTDMSRRYGDMVDYYTVWAHQIKTPIAAMRLKLQNEDSALSRALSGDLFRVEQYVEMVLMFLRLDSESTDYVIREYELDGIIRQTVKKFAGEFIARRLHLEYEPVDARVLTDEKWLSFVVEQVLSNALKYTPSGSVSITLEPPATLCVRDTGMGIAPEDLPRIFEKGYTGYHGRADKRASGIGLYLCRRICANLGHTITAQSVPEQGTVIRIDLAHTALEVE